MTKKQVYITTTLGITTQNLGAIFNQILSV